MRLEFKHKYLSIKGLTAVELPNFAVLIGRNGVGKTQLLDAVKNGHISVADMPTQEIEKYDMDTFRPNKAEQGSWANSNFAQNASGKVFRWKSESSACESRKKHF